MLIKQSHLEEKEGTGSVSGKPILLLTCTLSLVSLLVSYLPVSGAAVCQPLSRY